VLKHAARRLHRAKPETAAQAHALLGAVRGFTIQQLLVEYRALRFQLGPSRRTLVTVSAIFWHFLDALWLYLMVLFYVWG